MAFRVVHPQPALLPKHTGSGTRTNKIVPLSGGKSVTEIGKGVADFDI